MTTTSCFKRELPPLLYWMLHNNLPAAAVFFATAFGTLTVPYALSLLDDYGGHYLYTELSKRPFLVAMAAGTFLLALYQARWIHSPRQLDLYHSLPVGRQSLLLASAGAAFLTVSLPVALNYLLVLAAGAFRLGGELPAGDFLLDYLTWMVTVLVIIAIVHLTAVLVGGLLKNAFYALLLTLAPATLLFSAILVMEEYLIGFGTSSLSTDRVLLPLLSTSPVLLRYYCANPWRVGSGELADRAAWFFLPHLLLGGLLLWLACYLFRRRPCERAGSSWTARPLLLLGQGTAALLAGLLLGMVFHSASATYDAEVNLTGYRLPFLPMVFLFALGAALAYHFIAVRRLRGQKMVLPVVALMAAGVTAAAWALSSAPWYVEHVPDPAKVDQVIISYRGRYGELASPALSRDLGKGVQSYRNVALSSPEAIQTVVELHRSLLRAQQGAGKRQLGGELHFWYHDGVTREYDQFLSHYWDNPPRDLELLLALEEDLELRRQTDPRFTILPEDVVSIRVSDPSGLATSRRLTDREAIAAILAGAKADAEVFDYGSFRDGSARAAAYLIVETRDPHDYGGVYPADRELWQDFRLPVYQADSATLSAIRANGLSDYLRSREREAEYLLLEWWGDPRSERGMAYWTGRGPRDLDPVDGDPLTKDRSFSYMIERCGIIREPEQVGELLSLCLGADCHPSVPGFLITVVGEDRMGSSFFLPREEAPEYVQRWYRENEGELRQRNFWGLYKVYD